MWQPNKKVPAAKYNKKGAVAEGYKLEIPLACTFLSKEND